MEEALIHLNLRNILYIIKEHLLWSDWLQHHNSYPRVARVGNRGILFLYIYKKKNDLIKN